MAARIAVIDDDDVTRELMQTILQGAGYGVDVAEGGEAGVAVVERERPDIVLLHLLMPGVTGFDVCQRIRSGPAGHTTQIVIISAVGGVDEKVKALEMGADDFLLPLPLPQGGGRIGRGCDPAPPREGEAILPGG